MKMKTLGPRLPAYSVYKISLLSENFWTIREHFPRSYTFKKLENSAFLKDQNPLPILGNNIMLMKARSLKQNRVCGYLQSNI